MMISIIIAAWTAWITAPQESRPAASAADAPEKLIVIELGEGAAAFHSSAQRLAAHRGAEIVKIKNVETLDGLAAAVERAGAGALAIFVAPADLDINLNRRVWDRISKIDDDPFPDAAVGWFTGARPADVEAMLDSMERVEREGLPARRVHVGIAVLDNYTKYQQYGESGGANFEGIFLPIVEKKKDVRATLELLYKDTRGAGIITFSGNGDPMRAWLFDGNRNRHRELHWPFDPAKILRDYKHPEMPGLGAGDLSGWDPAPAVLWFSTCHSGVPCRAMVGGDIVSTFGDPGRNIYFYNLEPQESFCLNLIARAPSALVAPIGPNHGFATDVELSRAIGNNLNLGEAIRRNWIDLALAWREQGGVPLVQQKEGEREAIPAVPGAIMREGTANRILFGDPTFRPWNNIQNRKPTLRVATDFTNNDGRVAVLIEDPASGESWDPYHGPGRMERIVASFELPAGVAGVEEITYRGGVALAGGGWILEKRGGRPSRVWFTIFTKAPDDYQKRALWIRGAAHVFSVKLTKTAGAVSGGIAARG